MLKRAWILGVVLAGAYWGCTGDPDVVNKNGDGDGDGDQGGEGGIGGAPDSGDGDGPDAMGGTSMGGSGLGGEAVGGAGPLPEPTVGVPCLAQEDCPERTLCSVEESICVECVDDDGCSRGSACQGGRCVQGESCINSRDCDEGEVCDRQAGVCGQCLDDEDCQVPNNSCINRVCRPPCSSDKDCTSLDLLCLNDTYCAECVLDIDCGADSFCDEFGVCHAALCTPEEEACAGGEPFVCSAGGNAFETGDQTCSSGEE